jgi:type III restriction enzyme
MPSTAIENPVINSPYEVPARHFQFDESGITDEIVETRRPSEFFVPVPQTKKAGAQLQFDNEWTRERLKSNVFVNQVRGRVEIWRSLKYPYVTPMTERLLEHWADPSRENRVLFCQREAAETAIYLLEAAQKDGQGWMLNQLDEQHAEFNAGLPRIALKMATGSGKTVVMAMLIAWQTLNKAASPQDKRFTKRFLVVTPGITIRDRLRVLQPEDPGNYYRERDLVPADLRATLGQAQVFVTNYHVFLPRVTKEAVGLAKATKELLLGGRIPDADPFVETPDQVAARVARELGLQRGGEILVFNDEAHHCYREKPADRVDEELDADEKEEVEAREEEARVWFKGLQAIRSRLGIKTIYDLSATPFFLAGSGYGQGTLFPWVVSDFSLVDAIESGIVKVPRVPVDDNTAGDTVVYRNLWDEIALDLPRRAPKSSGPRTEEPMLPAKLEAALYSLYANYEMAFKQWEASGAAIGETPPVFIVVCNNTTVSKLVTDWISGYDREGRNVDGEMVTLPAPGKRLAPDVEPFVLFTRERRTAEYLADRLRFLQRPVEAIGAGTILPDELPKGPVAYVVPDDALAGLDLAQFSRAVFYDEPSESTLARESRLSHVTDLLIFLLLETGREARPI